MKAQTNVFGRVVKRYDMPLDAIDDLNNKYEERKKELGSFGPRLAGRLNSELEFTHLIGETKIAKNIVDCMNDYIETLDKINLFNLDFQKRNIEKQIKFNPSNITIKENEDLIIDNNDDFIVLNKRAGISVQGGTKSKKNLIDILNLPLMLLMVNLLFLEHLEFF